MVAGGGGLQRRRGMTWTRSLGGGVFDDNVFTMGRVGQEEEVIRHSACCSNENGDGYRKDGLGPDFLGQSWWLMTTMMMHFFPFFLLSSVHTTRQANSSEDRFDDLLTASTHPPALPL